MGHASGQVEFIVNTIDPQAHPTPAPTPQSLQFTHPDFKRGHPEWLHKIKPRWDRIGPVSSVTPHNLFSSATRGHVPGHSEASELIPMGSSLNAFASPSITLAASDRSESSYGQGWSGGMYQSNTHVYPSQLFSRGLLDAGRSPMADPNDPLCSGHGDLTSRISQYAPRSKNVYWGRLNFARINVSRPLGYYRNTH